jgi:hypothetical protein
VWFPNLAKRDKPPHHRTVKDGKLVGRKYGERTEGITYKEETKHKDKYFLPTFPSYCSSSMPSLKRKQYCSDIINNIPWINYENYLSAANSCMHVLPNPKLTLYPCKIPLCWWTGGGDHLTDAAVVLIIFAKRFCGEPDGPMKWAETKKITLNYYTTHIHTFKSTFSLIAFGTKLERARLFILYLRFYEQPHCEYFTTNIKTIIRI